MQGDLPRCLRRRPPLAIDLHLVPYHGQPLRDAQEVYRSKAKDGTNHFHAYATCYVIRQGLRFTLAVRRYSAASRCRRSFSGSWRRRPRPACGRVTGCWTAASAASPCSARCRTQA